MNWTSTTEQKYPTEAGMYYVTLCDDMYPEDAFWNQVEIWWFDTEWGLEVWEDKSVVNRVLAWCRVIPFVSPSQKTNETFGFN